MDEPHDPDAQIDKHHKNHGSNLNNHSTFAAAHHKNAKFITFYRLVMSDNRPCPNAGCDGFA
jgi:hypothetical protein